MRMLLAAMHRAESTEQAEQLVARTDKPDLLAGNEQRVDVTEVLQAIVDVTEPAQVRGIGNTAQLLALIDLVELLLGKGNLRHLN
jgi:hypothetical protein